MNGMQHFEAIKSLIGNSSTYYLIAVGMDSNYTYLNKHYLERFNPIHGDLVGKNYAITIHQDDHHTCRVVAEKAFMHKESVFPATLRKHDGKGGFIITRWEYKAMFDNSEVPLGMFCIGHDITELVQISGELHDIKNTQSHSIRRYVANLLGLSKIIQESTELGDVQDAAKMILQSATDLDNVIKDSE
ncbi:PAS domain S-box protein [Pedobacter sp. MC2016-15]|uniref:PAS domain S-box protein n=1 Tax=Pedobacter sp. MC2016-15 TaxID=2994473 RepID=UPI002245E903|nr:PAS domain S-box protein [Pedobacter sp. MC2016-15]MCX2479384.1 PAS domain S-box protein [Pedobacter sp. MC2016-15]